MASRWCHVSLQDTGDEGIGNSAQAFCAATSGIIGLRHRIQRKVEGIDIGVQSVAFTSGAVLGVTCSKHRYCSSTLQCKAACQDVRASALVTFAEMSPWREVVNTLDYRVLEYRVLEYRLWFAHDPPSVSNLNVLAVQSTGTGQQDRLRKSSAKQHLQNIP